MPKRKITEAVAGGVTPASGGRLLVQLISAGQGSSGFYPPETLAEAVTDRVFAAGTHMYVDHAGEQRRGPHGERSVKDLAGTLAEDGRWDEQAQAIVAEVDLLPVYADLIREASDDIGVSISAWALTTPGTDGSGNPVLTVDRITAAESADFVVAAGRGGKILQIIESAGRVSEVADSQLDALLDRAAALAHPGGPDTMGAYVVDYDADQQLAYLRIPQPGEVGALLAQHYTVADDQTTATLDGVAFPVTRVVTYLPVASAGPSQESTEPIPEEGTMALTAAEEADLRASAGRAAALETERDQAVKRATEAEQKLADQAKGARLATLHATLTEAVTGLPEQMAARIRHSWPDSLAEAELPADLAGKIAETVTAEKSYLAALSEGKLSGFGPSTTSTAHSHRTVNAFGRPIKEA